MTSIGSLFTGYGGLDMAVRMALDPDARIAWTSDVEPGPCKLAQVRWPGVPNLGDITQVDWETVEPVDIICGGSPCQDLSLAGKRAGMASGTRSGLWESMFEAIKTLRPRLVVWENVKGALTSGAFSLVESEKGQLGNRAAGPLLRAAGRVVGDLASIGYDSQWCVVRASDVGAPHQRERLFIVGHPAGEPWQLRELAAAGEATLGRALGESSRSDRAPGALIPTPQATNATASSAGYGANLHEVARGMETGVFGAYGQAIARWERVLGRPAPAPTVPSTREGGRSRLSTRFVEWVMGLPEGHVTGEDLGLTREQQLRLLGNGVVPQQGAAAIYQLTTFALKEAA
jgi:gp72